MHPQQRALGAGSLLRSISADVRSADDVRRIQRPKDLIRLHALNLTEYDAVMYVDSDVQIIGDIQPLLRCAASGEFMMTEGSGAPMNAGFMALKPEPRLLELAMWFAARADFSIDKPELRTLHGGWGDGSAWPALGSWPGFACGQGFLWTVFYGNGLGVVNATSKLVRDAWGTFPDGIHRSVTMLSMHTRPTMRTRPTMHNAHPSNNATPVHIYLTGLRLVPSVY